MALSIHDFAVKHKSIYVGFAIPGEITKSGKTVTRKLEAQVLGYVNTPNLPEKLIIDFFPFEYIRHSNGKVNTISSLKKEMRLEDISSVQPSDMVILRANSHQSSRGISTNDNNLIYLYDRSLVFLVPSDDKYPHVCPKCGSPAYIGFNKTECSRKGC